MENHREIWLDDMACSAEPSHRLINRLFLEGRHYTPRLFLSSFHDLAQILWEQTSVPAIVVDLVLEYCGVQRIRPDAIDRHICNFYNHFI